MSITLELTPELEATITRAAKLRGTDAQAFVLEAATRAAETAEAERQAALGRLRGRLKGQGGSVNDFLAERSAEGRQEAGL